MSAQAPGSAELAERLGALRARIDELGGPEVELVVVTKGFDVPSLVRVAELGYFDLGESYVQELVQKWTSPECSENGPLRNVRWHMIGQLQTNKVGKVAGKVHLYHGVDRERLVQRIAAKDPGAAVLLQVNVTEDVDRGGCGWDEVAALAASGTGAGLHVRGVMAVGRGGADAAATQADFERLVATADQLGLPVRSIGMSGDWEAAVAAGSNMVRIGSAVLGERSS